MKLGTALPLALDPIELPTASALSNTCIIAGCEKPTLHVGMCRHHRYAFLRYGDATYKKPQASCQVDSCTAPHAAKGYCFKHHARFKKYGDPTFLKRVQLNLPFCQADGCQNKPQSGSARYCQSHQRKFKKTGSPLGLSKIERFKKDFAENTVKLTNGCIVFTSRSSDKRGYTVCTNPLVKGGSRQAYAHRASHVVFNLDGQPITPDVYVLHSCDNPRCVNPEHLRSGDAQANQDDVKARGRRKTGKRGPQLPKQLVLNIKLALQQGQTGYSLAKKHGISQMSVSQIKRGKTYKDVNPEGWEPLEKSPLGRKPNRAA